MSLKILPYNSASKSAKVLAEALGVRRLKLVGSRWRGSNRDVVVNWGNCRIDLINCSALVLNNPIHVSNATNKLSAFEEMELAGVVVPEYTTDTLVATEWQEEGTTIVCRHLLRANSGRGIEIVTSDDVLPDAPLYVKYVKKNQEYRVHVGKLPDGSYSFFDIQRKMRDSSVPDDQVNWKVRNMDGGFVFGREGVEPIPAMLEQARKAIDALSLDFGAVDIIYNEHRDTYYVLEVNTAPGLMGTTLEKYTEYFNSWR